MDLYAGIGRSSYQCGLAEPAPDAQQEMEAGVALGDLNRFCKRALAKGRDQEVALFRYSLHIRLRCRLKCPAFHKFAEDVLFKVGHGACIMHVSAVI